MFLVSTAVDQEEEKDDFAHDPFLPLGERWKLLFFYASPISFRRDNIIDRKVTVKLILLSL